MNMNIYIKPPTNLLEMSNLLQTTPSKHQKLDNPTFYLETSVIIMEKTAYQQKLQTMIDEGIEQGKYVHSEDTIIKDLESLNISSIVTSKITQNTN